LIPWEGPEKADGLFETPAPDGVQERAMVRPVHRAARDHEHQPVTIGRSVARHRIDQGLVVLVEVEVADGQRKWAVELEGLGGMIGVDF